MRDEEVELALRPRQRSLAGDPPPRVRDVVRHPIERRVHRGPDAVVSHEQVLEPLGPATHGPPLAPDVAEDPSVQLLPYPLDVSRYANPRIADNPRIANLVDALPVRPSRRVDDVNQHVRVAQVVEEGVTPAPTRVRPGDQPCHVFDQHRYPSAVLAVDILRPVRGVARPAEPRGGARASHGRERATDVGVDRGERVRGAPGGAPVRLGQLSRGVEKGGLARRRFTDEADDERPSTPAGADDERRVRALRAPQPRLRVERLHRRGLDERRVGVLGLPPPPDLDLVVVCVVIVLVTVTFILVVLVDSVVVPGFPNRGEVPGGDRASRRALRPLPHLRHDGEQRRPAPARLPRLPGRRLQPQSRHAIRDFARDPTQGRRRERGGVLPG